MLNPLVAVALSHWLVTVSDGAPLSLPTKDVLLLLRSKPKCCTRDVPLKDMTRPLPSVLPYAPASPEWPNDPLHPFPPEPFLRFC